MTKIFLTTLLIGFGLVAFAQNNADDNVKVDFFYGTWTDSTKTGMTLTKEKQFLRYPKQNKLGLEDLDSSDVSWIYNLFLDYRPILIEITCTQCDDKPIHKKLRGQIEILNSRQIYFTTLNQNGEIKETVLMTKE